MKSTVFAGMIMFAVLSAATAATAADNFEIKEAPIDGAYYEFGGAYTEETAPKVGDAKVSFHLKGELAESMFRNMGAAASFKSECDAPNEENRKVNDIICVRTISTGAVECFFVINLEKGQTQAPLIC